MATGYDERFRVTNISGTSKHLPWLPWGRKLAASGYVDVKASDFYDMTFQELEGLDTALDKSYVSIEKIPVSDPNSRVAEEKTLRVDWPNSAEAAGTTGAQAHFYSPTSKFGKVAPGQMKLVGGEVHFDSGVYGTYVPATERDIALQVDGVIVSNWMNALASGPAAAMSAAGRWEEGRSLGDVVPFTNIQPTGTTITAGSQVSLYLTGYVNAAAFTTGPTGAAMIRVVPDMS